MKTKTNGNDLAFAKAAFYQPDGGYDVPQPSYGLKSKAYKHTQSNIKHYGKSYKPYQKENVFQQGIKLIRK